jgi:hypothetical protein
MEVLRFDFNGSSGEFKRTPQGFLRVNARLSKTGIFDYQSTREYRGAEEVFRTDSLESLCGAPVTDRHPSESSDQSFLTPSNVKSHMVGITQSVERDGDYLKGSLLIFHEDTIKAIERGDLKEISLGYRCEVDPTPGTHNGEAYDAIQKNIIINHVALGPKGWGRAGPDCAIRADSNQITKGLLPMSETIRLDGIDVALTADSILALFAEKKRQFQELSGRLDAIGLELEKEKAAKAELEDPKTIDAKVQSRMKLLEKCRKILGLDEAIDGKSDEELKLQCIKKVYPELDLSGKEPSYTDGMFDALSVKEERNDSLINTRQALNQEQKANNAYEKWIESTSKLWSIPLTGSARS